MKITTKRIEKFLRKSMSLFLCALMIFSVFASEAALLKSMAASSPDAESEEISTLGDLSRADLNFNKNWKFGLGEYTGAMSKAFDDSSWETTDLPHDFSISQKFTNKSTEVESGNLPAGTGWYRKMFTLPADLATKEIYLTFDGVYNNAYVYVNGKLLAQNHYGYNSFTVSIGDYVTCNGNTWNIIAVKVDSEMASSRWYSGSGIYRDVTMTIMNTVHVANNGTHITTPSVSSSSATVDATVTLSNDSSDAKNVNVTTSVVDPNGNTVSAVNSSANISSKGSTDVSFTHSVSSPKLWDIDTPNLYKLKTIVSDTDGNILDEYTRDFGIRTMEWETDTGFYLNGRSVKIKGMCMHHDQGALGSVQEYDAIYRQLKMLKDMGCNAVRTSHNTASRTFIEICNKLGLLVMEEFFDDWDSPKNGNTNDFSKYFSRTLGENNHLIGGSATMTWSDFVVRSTMLRDRNDPCIIMWSMGNELYQAVSKTNYSTIANSMSALIKSLDDTRAITQGNDQSRILDVDTYVDVQGANYHPSAWTTLKRNKAFSKPFIATETASTITSRGTYSYSSDRQGGKVSKTAYALYSYDNSKVQWGDTAATAWYYTASNDWWSGEFVWTGFDYIGEPTPWNSNGAGGSTVPNSAYFGVIDTAGFPKDQYYLYRSWWNENDTTLHILPGTWNQDNLYLVDGYAYVNVYSNADHIELLLNGNVIGTAQATEITTDNGYKYKTWTETVVDSANCNTNEIFNGIGHDLYAQFGVKYAEGTLSVKAYDAANNEITDTVGTKSISSGKAAAKVVAKLWGNESYVANSHDYAYVEFEAVDSDGNFVNDYNGKLTVSVNNNGEIVGVDNGFQGTTEKFRQSSVISSETSATIKMFNGKALAIVKTTDVPNNIHVTATLDDGLTVDGATFTSRIQTQEEKDKIFENVVLQSTTPYQPTIYDRYDMICEEFAALDKVDNRIHYVYTPVNKVKTTTTDVVLPSGDYIIYGASDNTGSTASCGAMKHEVCTGNSKGVWATGKSGLPAASDPTWHFERLANGKYNIYYTDDSSVKHYITLGTSSGSLTLSETPYELTVEINDKGVLIGNGVQYVNYYGSKNPMNVISTWSDGTALSLYTVNEAVVSKWEAGVKYACDLESGEYAFVSGNNFVAYNEMLNASLIKARAASIEDTILYQNEHNYYTFEKVENSDGFTYYIKNMAGKYINFGSTNTSLSLSDTPQGLKVYVNGDGSISIYNEAGQFMDHYQKEAGISTWEGTTGNIIANRKFKLYKKTSDSESIDEVAYELYTAMKNALEFKPGQYNEESYKEFITAFEEAVEIYKNPSSTNAQKKAAAAALKEAEGYLSSSIKKFPARIIKYGYNPNSENPYDRGGVDFNYQTYAQMRSAIKANSDLMTQIKKVIDYDGSQGTVWAEGYADKALDKAVAEYATIYSLSFRDYTVTGGLFANNLYMTNWNHWQKDNTQIDGERQDEGVSLQGIYSKTLGNGNIPVSHTAYTTGSGLDYLSGHSKTGLRSNVNVDFSIDETNSKSVELTPLDNISVYVPDFFSAQNVKSSDGGYSKFYWDTEFPFFVSTDSDGVNHFVYDSSDSTHMIRASYDDDNQTAVVDLESDSDWSVNRPYAGAGKGFFPFNYQKDAQANGSEYTNENAIYHFGMTFEMDFYIPKGGKATKTSEDYEFSFSGDDDVLVYVDDVLVLDNGGLHGARGCSINFTDASVTYQYVMNIADRKTITNEAHDLTYQYGRSYDSISDVNQTAIEYLNKIRNDGEKHTFRFFYMERGSTESNCKITFNLQQISEHISLNDQTLVADYGLPITYNVQDNNTVSNEAKKEGATIEYIGVTDEIEKAISFTEPEDFIKIDRASTLKLSGEYGNYTISKDGNVTYEPTSMEFNGSDYFYMCAKIKNDPTYSNGTVYYAYEKVTFVPATNIYYEENFFEGYQAGVSYANGKTAASFDNSTAQYGVWSEVKSGAVAAKQAADLVGDPTANAYGYDPNYSNSGGFSNGTARKVTVSAKNNPNSKYSGGSGSAWPELTFTFTGTGFDLISVTDNTTGMFTVEVYKGTDTTAKAVKRSIVDTYYGFSYAKLYADENGEPTSAVTDVPLYWTKNNHVSANKMYYGPDGVITNKVHYYDVSGKGYSETPSYYDENGKLTAEETENPAYSYAYAYGWIKDENSTTDSLYQIPVIGVEGLDYGLYTVKVIPKFSTMYGHYNEDVIGEEKVNSYNLYVDGIRVYNPAGEGENIKDKTVSEAYRKDGEAYPNYLEVRNMLIGADSFGKNPTEHGIIFIDGIPALDNDIEKYKNAGPNNELYMCSGQAVAFEIWATAVPSDIQVFAKTAKGTPTLRLTYDGLNVEKQIESATQMTYSLDDMLPIGHKIEWTQVTVNGVSYYTSGPIVVSNSSEQDTILSIGRLKWTFSTHGAYGFFKIPEQTPTDTLDVMSTNETIKTAFSAVSTMYTDTVITNKNVSVEGDKHIAGDNTVISITTSNDVKSVVIKDRNGNVVKPADIVSYASSEEADRTVWKITMNTDNAGTYVYTVTGVNEYGVESSSSASFTFTVEAKQQEPETPDKPTHNKTFFEKLVTFFKNLYDFLKKLFTIKHSLMG